MNNKQRLFFFFFFPSHFPTLRSPIIYREEVLKRCKALHRNIVKYGGESPRKRYRYSSVSSTSSMASIASVMASASAKLPSVSIESYFYLFLFIYLFERISEISRFALHDVFSV